MTVSGPSLLRPSLLVLVFTCGAFAQPFLPPNSILNAASYMQPGLPGGALAQGSMFSIFGRSLGPAVPAQATAFPLGATLQGVSIRVTQGARSVDVYPIYVSATQINAILPSNAPLGLASLQVTFSGARSNLAPVRIAPNSPGLFTATGYGAGPGIFQNYVSAADQPINSSLNSVKPGQVVTLWGTGLGPITSADNVAPPVGTLNTGVQVFVGNKAVTNLLYAGRAPCCAAVDQIVFEIPADTPEGCFVPVQLRSGGAVSNSVTMAVRREGGACVDSANPLATAFAAGKKTGLAAATRFRMRADTSVPTNRDFTGDFASVFLTQPAGMPFSYDPLVALPPPGSCSTYTATGDLLSGSGLLRAPGRALNAGAVTATGGRGPVAVNGSTLVGVNGELPGIANQPLFYTTGNATLRAAGGADVGAFEVTLASPAGVSWSNRDTFATVDRSRPVEFRFSGGGSRPVFVGGIGVDLPTNSSAMFLCRVPAQAESFSVPAVMLGNIQPTRSRVLRSPGVLFITLLSDQKDLSATGLDAGSGFAVDIQSKTVIFR